MSTDKQRQVNAISREKRKRNPEREDHSNDGTTLSREMVANRWGLAGKKYLAEMRNPDTIHPLSFEEFDSIPDIEELTIKEKK
jgi:hypothetical protein|tara:strand:+ start:153 stop:401 length:249 start_codon:yes stop_codon:yes gene_type:complete